MEKNKHKEGKKVAAAGAYVFKSNTVAAAEHRKVEAPPPLPKARRLPVENEGTAAAAALLLLPPPLLLARSAAAGAVTATNAVAVEVTHPTAIAAATPFIVSSKCWMNPLTTLKNKKQKKKRFGEEITRNQCGIICAVQ